MKPLDPRLLRYARSARRVLGVGGLLGFVRTLATVAWSWCLASALAALVLPVLGGTGSAADRVAEGLLPQESLPWLLACALAALLVRSLCSWGMEAVAARGAVAAKAELRAAALDAVDARSPDRGDGRSDSELATALGRGLDALDGYFSGYLPQLILTAVATPILVLAVLFADIASGIVALVVFPVIPLFMVLIGLATQSVQDRQWRQLQHLSASFLDVVAGLATLRIFGRERKQSERIAREAEEYRSRTMKVLRVTFLSGFVLDLAGTFSIALVAVTIGTRMVDGRFPLALGLFVLLLLPEAFIPIRQVGAAYHASAEGLVASAEVLDLIEAQPRAVSRQEAGGAVSGARLVRVVIARGERTVVGPVSFGVSPGEVVALAGHSGAGKSTLLSALLGFVQLDSGSIDRAETVSWAGQRPGLLQGSVAQNVALGLDEADPMLVRRALDAAALPGLDPDLVLGAGGAGVSGGQAQRIAVARCLYRAWDREAGLLLLDEPTSALDAVNEARICEALRAEAEAGRAVLVASHRQAVLDSADRVVRLETAEASA